MITMHVLTIFCSTAIPQLVFLSARCRPDLILRDLGVVRIVSVYIPKNVPEQLSSLDSHLSDSDRCGSNLTIQGGEVNNKSGRRDLVEPGGVFF